jgi:hypothetical protein
MTYIRHNLTSVLVLLLMTSATLAIQVEGAGSGSSAIDTTETFPAVERLLVPVLHHGAPGRFGSLWVGSLLAGNRADVPVFFSTGFGISSLPGGGLVRIQPGATVPVFGSVTLGGQIFAVEKEYADDVHLSLRIADVNRRPVNQGTEIPIVREQDWKTEPVELLDIPTDVLVRQTLRIYEPEGTNRTGVRVAFHPLFGTQPPIAEVVLEPRGGSEMTLSPWFSGVPAFVEIPDLIAAFPQLAIQERIRIRIEPLTPGMRYWAFVTITDNATQQVTVVTPQ